MEKNMKKENTYVRMFLFNHYAMSESFATPWTAACPGSSVQAGILEWVAALCPWGLPAPGLEPASLMSPALAGGCFTTSTTYVGSLWFSVK